MAHGNLSDIVALSLIAVAAQFIWASHTLFTDVGPMKASFSQPSADLTMLLKFAAGLIFTIGMMFSGVKWNPGNGKMAGLGCFFCAGCSAYSTFKSDSGVFVPHLMYVYCAIIMIGGLHIFLFPSNPLVSKVMGKENVQNNHGNTSDKIFFLDCGIIALEVPSMMLPLKATLKTRSADIDAMIKFTAGLLLTLACMFSGVKWNPANGKMGGLGCFICAGYTAYSKYKMDSDTLVPSLFYVYATVLVLGGVHIFFFPSNPLVKPADKDKKK